jgi:hypothetical protein
VIIMKRAILVALALVVAIAPAATIAYADYGPVTEAPASLDDVQAP